MHGRLVPLLVAVAIVGAMPLAAQHRLAGRVMADGAPVRAARVLLGDDPAVVTGADGRFALRGVQPGAHRLRITAIGFAPRELAVELPRDTVLGDVVLRASPVEVSDLVVTGTLAEVRLADSPVKVEVVARTALQRNLTTNLMESVRTLPGLREQVDCGVCYSNSISINGMEGAYTAVLIDGIPLLGALSTVYALNSLNPALLEQVEIVKGPASTLYGSEAMGGVVNVITRDPRTAPAWSLNSTASSHGELSLDAMARPMIGDGRLLLAGTVAHNDRFVDANGDAFSDLPLVTRVAAFAKWSDGTVSARRADVVARWWHEDRFGGVHGWTPADRGSSEVYGESIYTDRWELLGGFRPALLGDALRIDAALSHHEQDSYYGDQPYRARQSTWFAQAAWAPQALGRIRPLAGVTWRRQRYDDDTPATATVEDRSIPGVFAEGEFRLSPALHLLAGSRIDHHRAHGAIVSPRLALRWEAGPVTTVRLNAATGFRVVHLFTESHAALTGSREVVVAETLDPERSVTVTASLATTLGWGALPLRLEADAFVTRFSNRILPDYDTNPDQIIYRNLDGHALTRGLSFGLAADAPGVPVTFRLGGTWQRVVRTVQGVTSEVPFAPGFKGDFTVSWHSGERTLDWTGSVTSPMALPRIAGRRDRSPWFTEQNLQVTMPLKRTTFATIGVKNLFDTRQRDPLVGAADPFGPAFDTNHVWGPTQGWRLFVAVQWNAPI